jgi:parallel beta-helix repeat protein
VTIQNINIKSFSDGILLHASVNNRIIGNNVSDNNQGILLAYSSNGNSLIGNTITANWGDGIMLHSALNNGIGENTIANNNYNGIKLEQSSNYTSIFGNNIANNSQYGIWFDASSDNSISGNTIVNNLYGVMIDYNSEPWYCVNNTFCHNNFISNTRHVINWTPTDAHHWDNGCEGNFWDNYNGTDLDNDGVGDTFLPWNWVDNYPLMNLYWNPCDIDHNLKVDMKDIGKSAKAFGTQSGDTLWNPHADITGLEPLVPDGKVDMRDISLIARHFMEHYP